MHRISSTTTSDLCWVRCHFSSVSAMVIRGARRGFFSFNENTNQIPSCSLGAKFQFLSLSNKQQHSPVDSFDCGISAGEEKRRATTIEASARLPARPERPEPFQLKTNSLILLSRSCGRRIRQTVRQMFPLEWNNHINRWTRQKRS